MRYKVIYTCGDSHTAGGETADDQIWPDQHPGFFSEDTIALRDMRAIMRWREFRDRSLRRGDPVGWTDWQQREHANAWPARLGELLGCEVVNRARIGSSMEWIARQTITDVSDLLTKHQADQLLVLVQPSTYLRMQMHDPTQGGWTSFQMADAYGMDQHVHQWFNLHETDASLATRWMIACIGMIGYLKAQGVSCLLIDSAHNPMPKMLDDPLLAAVSRAYRMVSDDLWHPRSMEHAAAGIELRYCPDLHWTREVHAALATDIAETLG